MIHISVRSPKAQAAGFEFHEYEGDFDFGESLQEAVDKFGEDVVFNLAQRMCETDIGNKLRQLMNPSYTKVDGDDVLDTGSGYSQAEADAYLASYRPGVKQTMRSGKPSFASLLAMAGSLSSEERAAMLEALNQG